MSATTRVRAVLPVVVVDYALTHIGYFVVMPVLPLMLAASLEAQDATWIGLCLGALSLSMRVKLRHTQSVAQLRRIVPGRQAGNTCDFTCLVEEILPRNGNAASKIGRASCRERV